MIEKIKNNLNKLDRYYREAEEKLRYDGNKINNFASIVYCNEDRELIINTLIEIKYVLSITTPNYLINDVRICLNSIKNVYCQ